MAVYYVKSRKKKPIWFRLTVLLVLLMLMVVCAEAVFRSIAGDVIKSQDRAMAANAINSAALQLLASEEQADIEFVSIERDSQGEIVAISANAQQVNMFKTDMANAVSEVLKDDGVCRAEVPLGTLLGSRLFSGSGPRVSIRIEPVGDVLTTLRSSFTSAGINQTRHRIVCTVNVRIAVILPGCTVYVQTQCDYLISETIIVGTVPESYTDVEGDDSDIIGKIFDYADVD